MRTRIRLKLLTTTLLAGTLASGVLTSPAAAARIFGGSSQGEGYSSYDDGDDYTPAGSVTTSVTTQPAGSSSGWASSFLDQSALSARAAVVIDNSTGEVLLDKRSSQVVPMASITKLMTAMVTIDEHPDMAERITLSAEDFVGAKQAGSKLRIGDTLNRAELLLIMLMKSENPAAKALARHSRMGYEAFVQAMNRKARAIGMRSATFFDTSGLSSGNRASPYDIARMVNAASEYGTIRQFSTQRKYDFFMPDRVLSVQNTNALVRNGGYNIGLSKTGYINEAGRCVAMQAQVNRRPATIVIMGASNSQNRTLDAQHILGWLQNRFSR